MEPSRPGKQGGFEGQRITVQINQNPLYTVFYRLIQKYDIAIGFEESILDRDHRHYYFGTNVELEHFKKEVSSDKERLGPYTRFDEHLITVNFKDARLEDVMNAIVRQMENYSWEINDEVVNIFPIRGRDERLAKLLDVKVRTFYVGIGADVGSIQGRLMLFLPEFEKFLAENKLDSRTDRPEPTDLDHIFPDGMVFTGLTFKQLLNAITKSKRGGWILQIKTDTPGKEFVEILI
jgi:hypothetical protein